MSCATISTSVRVRPALAALGLGLLGLTTTVPTLAANAGQNSAMDDRGSGGGLRVSQALDPYAASPSGDPAPGTPGAPSSYSAAENRSNYGTSENRSNAATAGAGTSSGDWWMPGGGRTSVGLNLGSSKFRVPCESGFACDDKDNYVALTARNMANENVGGEIGLVDMGRMTRSGGRTRASGLNLSLVGKTATLAGGAGGLGAFGKIGSIYGQTHTDVAAGSTLAGGTKNGFGLSLGAGLSWDFTPRTSAILEMDRYWFKFAGTGKDPVNTTSIGLQLRY